MENEKMRVKIAELLGFKWVVIDYGTRKERALSRRPEDGPADGTEKLHWNAMGEVPNYPRSLDACAEFEKGLTGEQSIRYEVALLEIVMRGATTPPGERYPSAASVAVWHATAQQRCEAFLRVHGAYEEPPAKEDVK